MPDLIRYRADDFYVIASEVRQSFNEPQFNQFRRRFGKLSLNATNFRPIIAPIFYEIA